MSEQRLFFKIENDLNRLYCYSRYGTGTSLQLRGMQGIFSNANDINLFIIFNVIPPYEPPFQVPVQFREY